MRRDYTIELTVSGKFVAIHIGQVLGRVFRCGEQEPYVDPFLPVAQAAWDTLSQRGDVELTTKRPE